MTALGIDVTDRDPETVHDWQPGRRDWKPEYLLKAIADYEQACRDVSEAADRHELGDPRLAEVTRADVERCLRALNHKKFLMEKAWLAFETEQAARAADWQDEQAMYNDLRHGG